MWVDYKGSLGTVYSDEEISTCGRITEFYQVLPDTPTLTSWKLVITYTVQDTYTDYNLS